MNEKIKELYVGQEFKNYKVLCEYVGESVKTGKSRQLQLKDWKRFFSYRKEGHKFIITEIFENPKEKLIKSGGNWDHFKHPVYGIYNLDKEQGNLKGVYKIQLNNKVYIGSTIVGFRTRYRQHCINNQGLSTHTQALLKQGASFEILWIADKNDSESTIRQKENDYIEQYRNDEYDMLNSHVPVIISEKRTVNSKKKKIKYKKIKINETDYEKAITLLAENGLRIAV